MSGLALLDEDGEDFVAVHVTVPRKHAKRAELIFRLMYEDRLGVPVAVLFMCWTGAREERADWTCFRWPERGRGTDEEIQRMDEILADPDPWYGPGGGAERSICAQLRCPWPTDTRSLLGYGELHPAKARVIFLTSHVAEKVSVHGRAAP